MAGNHPWDSDVDVDQSVQRVAGRLFALLRAPRPRRRIARAGVVLVAASALFAGGIAFGAVAYASPGRALPGAAAPTASASGGALAVSCFLAANAAPADAWSVQQFARANNPASRLRLSAAEASPAETCLPALDQERQLRSFDAAIGTQHARGVDCGLIITPGVPDFFFHLGTSVSSSSSGSTILFLLHDSSGQVIVQGNFLAQPEPLPSGCPVVSLPATPKLDTTALAACGVDSTHASVYVRGYETASAVCKRHAYSLWRQ